MIAQECGLTLLPEFFGETVHICFCAVRFPNGAESMGAGKSLISRDQALLVAIYEAIEHYATEKEGGGQQAYHSRSNIHRNDQQYSVYLNSPDLNLILGENEIKFTCQRFKNILGPTENVLYPQFLYDLDFKPKTIHEASSIEEYQLKRYSSNSGTSCHSTLSASILHGLLEVIERDSLGLGLLRHVISNCFDVASIEVDDYTSKIGLLACAIESEINCKLILFDLTSDLGIPTIMSGLQWHDEPCMVSYGTASAINAEDAVYRAILEAVQIYFADKHYPEERLSLERDDRSLMSRCCVEAGEFDVKGRELSTPLSEWLRTHKPAFTECGDAVSDLRALALHLKRHGVDAYWRELESPSEKFAKVVVIAPLLERFHLLARGKWVTPGARGREAICYNHSKPFR